MNNLSGRVCLVTGASRGIGRGIALGLGECGAIVYITGRTLKSADSGDVGGSLEDTAAEINARGGQGIPVMVDHTDERQITELFERIRREQRGRLDVLVNNAYAAVPFLLRNGTKPYFEIDEVSPGEAWDIVNNVGLRNHYICSTLATRMMLEYRKQSSEQDTADNSPSVGLIVNVSSLGGKTYFFCAAYGAGKCALDRLTSDMSKELKRSGAPISVVSLWPGLVRTEQLKRNVELNPDGAFASQILQSDMSESPEFSGRVVAALAAESNETKLSRSGQVVLVADVAQQYGIRDADGNIPGHCRSIRTIMLSLGYSFGTWVPGFIRLPKSWYMYALGWNTN